MTGDGRPAERNHVTSPPPDPTPTHPEIVVWREGTEILRVFNPSAHTPTELSFRPYGPLLRFDHHRGSIDEPSVDEERGIWYGAPLAQPPNMVSALEICMWECFGQERRVPAGRALGRVSVGEGQTLKLLSLIDVGAVRAGTVAQISMTPNPRDSQEWSRFFYEHPNVYEEIDGLLYRSSWIGGINVALYERGTAALESHPAIGSLSLQHPALAPTIAEIALNNGWTLARARLPEEDEG